MPHVLASARVSLVKHPTQIATCQERKQSGVQFENEDYRLVQVCTMQNHVMQNHVLPKHSKRRVPYIVYYNTYIFTSYGIFMASSSSKALVRAVLAAIRSTQSAFCSALLNFVRSRLELYLQQTKPNQIADREEDKDQRYVRFEAW